MLTNFAHSLYIYLSIFNNAYYFFIINPLYDSDIMQNGDKQNLIQGLKAVLL